MFDFFRDIFDSVQDWWGEQGQGPQPAATGGPATGPAGGQAGGSTGPLPAPRPPPSPHVAYLGINGASREKESEAFKGMDNATVIKGAGTDAAMQGKTLAADGKTVLDLSNEADLQRYMTEVGVGGVRTGADGKPIETAEAAQARMAQLTNIFLGEKDENGVRQGGIDAGARDEMAGFLKVLQRAETGEINLDRIVMSGHSTGEWVYSEEDGRPGVAFTQMAALMEQFPQARAGVKDFMLSACHTLENFKGHPSGTHLDTRSGEQYTDIFPNLETTWGYNGYSPSWKQGSTQHIKNWLGASAGDDPAKVAAAAKKSGQNATVKQY